ncbi:MAG: hypothetical protein ACXVPK_12155 [Tumebacillaceae bacterium]
MPETCGVVSGGRGLDESATCGRFATRAPSLPDADAAADDGRALLAFAWCGRRMCIFALLTFRHHVLITITIPFPISVDGSIIIAFSVTFSFANAKAIANAAGGRAWRTPTSGPLCIAWCTATTGGSAWFWLSAQSVGHGCLTQCTQAVDASVELSEYRCLCYECHPEFAPEHVTGPTCSVCFVPVGAKYPLAPSIGTMCCKCAHKWCDTHPNETERRDPCTRLLLPSCPLCLRIVTRGTIMYHFPMCRGVRNHTTYHALWCKVRDLNEQALQRGTGTAADPIVL